MKYKFKIYYLCNAILAGIFCFAFFFHFISIETFSLVIASHVLTKICIYFDNISKNEITFEKKIEIYSYSAMAVMFFCFMIWMIFVHNMDKKGFGPTVLEKKEISLNRGKK